MLLEYSTESIVLDQQALESPSLKLFWIGNIVAILLRPLRQAISMSRLLCMALQ